MKQKKSDLTPQEKIVFKFADSIEMDKREEIAEKFYHCVLDPEELPIIVTDKARLGDISTDDDKVLIARIKEHYGITVTQEHLRMPIWRLLDILENKEHLPTTSSPK
jgi:hypothetical protein